MGYTPNYYSVIIFPFTFTQISGGKWMDGPCSCSHSRVGVKTVSDGGMGRQRYSCKVISHSDAHMNKSTPFVPLRYSFSIGSQYTTNDHTVEKMPGFNLSPVKPGYF